MTPSLRTKLDEIRKRHERMPKVYVVAADWPDHGWRAHLDRGELLEGVYNHTRRTREHGCRYCGVSQFLRSDSDDKLEHKPDCIIVMTLQAPSGAPTKSPTEQNEGG